VAGGIPILALDMYEHAYHIDFGANARAYIDAFMRNVDWNAVQARHEDASSVAPPRPLVQPEFGAVWRDPERVQEWCSASMASTSAAGWRPRSGTRASTQT